MDFDPLGDRFQFPGQAMIGPGRGKRELIFSVLTLGLLVLF